MKLNSLTLTATTNGLHSKAVTPHPNWNNPKALSTHYVQNGGSGIDTGMINGVHVIDTDSSTQATWKLSMDSAGAYENLGPWSDEQHKNHFHTSFRQKNP